jgi:transposase
MGRERRSFTREFKREAVRLAESGDRPVAQVANDLGIDQSVLRRWIMQHKQDREQSFPGKGRLKERDEEIRRLERELARVKEERDILKNHREALPRPVGGETWVQRILARPRGAAVCLLVVDSPTKNVVQGRLRT